MTTDINWMQRALDLAEQAEAKGEVPVGAVLVDSEGKLIAEAYNQSICQHDPTAHAEIMLLRQAGQEVENYRLTGSTLYVTLEPCPMCAGAMVHARVSRLVYGAPDPRTGAAGTVFQLASNDLLNHRMEITSGVLQEECAAQLKAFFKMKREHAKALKKQK